MRLKNKVALITGGSTGMGLATAELFLKEGASVMIAGRNSQEGRRAVDRLQAISSSVAYLQADVSEAASVQNLVRETVSRFGKLDLAFNNAGIEGKFAPIIELDESDFDQTISINLKGVWLSCKYEMEQMKLQGTGGVIVNNSSWLAKGAFSTTSIYSASKAGLDGMVRSLALEGGPVGIRVNNVNPGYIDTPMLRRFMDPESEVAQPIKKHAPIGRFATADEVAHTVAWLCSDAASFVTGQCISVDGGIAIASHGSIQN